jgi:hypothetical protein
MRKFSEWKFHASLGDLGQLALKSKYPTIQHPSFSTTRRVVTKSVVRVTPVPPNQFQIKTHVCKVWDFQIFFYKKISHFARFSFCLIG